MGNLNQKGFTLVEIAIVLVIIGLLIGGILKVQEMITNAKLKRIESDMAGLATAMFSYQDRYWRLPGDDNRASFRFAIYAPADPVDGDGSGSIDGVWNITPTLDVTAAATDETNLFFAHLRASGLIPGSGIDDTKPSNNFGGQIGIQDGSLGISGHVMIIGPIEGFIAKILESRLDDSDPASGRIRSGFIANTMAPAGIPEASYLDSLKYNLALRIL